VRIFIDCSYIDFSRQPTGIPRVVLKYIETGYEWGQAHGVDVVPVVTTKDGLYPVRPVPGKAPPKSLARYAAPQLDEVAHGAAAAAHLREAQAALQAALVDAGAAAAVGMVEGGVASLFATLVNGTDDALLIKVKPGDLVFYPAYWHDIDPKHLKNLSDAGARVFILVHDILPITFAKFYQTPWRESFADNLLAACATADGLFAVSQYTADKVIEFARENGVTVDHVEVLHNGYDPLVEDPEVKAAIDDGSYRTSFARKSKFDFYTKNQPFLMVGTIEPKKGHIPVIDVFEDLWRRGLDRKLALVGRRGWLDEPVLEKIKGSEFYGDKLFWFDDHDDLDLYVAYKYSRALIFSSYAEGFGIPMVEAAMAQLPLICYDTEVAREVAGKHAMFYSNRAEFEHFLTLMEQDEAREKERAKLANFQWPSWRDIGMRLFEHLPTTAA
jgi:alpha-1,2-rhamnosyltransferase